jgi:hypothetical protein
MATHARGGPRHAAPRPPRPPRPVRAAPDPPVAPEPRAEPAPREGGAYRWAPRPGAQNIVTGRKVYNPTKMLTAELLVAGVIVGIRVVAHYEIQGDGTVKGKITPPAGEYGPFTVITGLIGVFFMLSFLASAGGTKGKIAVVAGGMIDIVLAMKSLKDIEKVLGVTLNSDGSVTKTAVFGTGTSSGSSSFTLAAASTQPDLTAYGPYLLSGGPVTSTGNASATTGSSGLASATGTSTATSSGTSTGTPVTA